MLLSTGRFYLDGAGGGGGGPLDASFTEGRSGTSATTNTVDFGAEDPDRYIVIAAGICDGPGNARSLSACTIGGVTSDILVNRPAGTSSNKAAIFIAHVPTGLTGTVIFTTTGYNRFGFGVYRLVGLSSPTPYDSAFLDTTAGGGVSLDIPAGGFAIACSGFWSTAGSSISGVTQQYTTTAGSGHRATVGSKASVAGETITVDCSTNSGNQKVAAVSFL